MDDESFALNDDGTIRLRSLLGFRVHLVMESALVLVIDEGPEDVGNPARRIQLAMTPMLARHLGEALLRASRKAESAASDRQALN